MLVGNELKKLKSSDLGYFIGKHHFDEDGAENYLVFQPMLHWIVTGLQNRSQNDYLTKVLKFFLQQIIL